MACSAWAPRQPPTQHNVCCPRPVLSTSCNVAHHRRSSEQMLRTRARRLQQFPRVGRRKFGHFCRSGPNWDRIRQSKSVPTWPASFRRCWKGNAGKRQPYVWSNRGGNPHSPVSSLCGGEQHGKHCSGSCSDSRRALRDKVALHADILGDPRRLCAFLVGYSADLLCGPWARAQLLRELGRNRGSSTSAWRVARTLHSAIFWSRKDRTLSPKRGGATSGRPRQARCFRCHRHHLPAVPNEVRRMKASNFA